MELDINFLIDFFRKHSYDKSSTTIDEEEAAGATPSGGSTGTAPSGKTPKKWESGRKFGATYMNDPKHKWTSGRTMGKTYMGDPKYQWTSGRTIGKTGGSDYA